MKSYVAFLLLSTLLLLPLSVQADPTVYDYEIVNTYPHNTNAFTQGLLFHDGYLYEGTGRRGQSRLMKIDLEKGEVLRSRQLASRYFGEGIAVVEDRIYQLTWQSNMVFVYELESFSPLATHFHPTEGWGLTYDGEQLILSDGTARLQFIDPDDFSLQRVVEVSLRGEPLSNLNELEYINGEVWANVWMTNEIVRIDPVSGDIRGVIDLSGLVAHTRVGGSDAVLNGIAWDEASQRLLVTGKLWADIFEIRLVPRETGH